MSFHVFRNEKLRLASDERKEPRRRRRRMVVTCTPCRLLKVSCDRKAPCSRCVWRGKASECTYCEFPRKVILAEPRGRVVPSCDAHPTMPDKNGQPNRSWSSMGGGIDHGSSTNPPWYTPQSALRGATHWDGMLHQFQHLLPDNQESRKLLDNYLMSKSENFPMVEDSFLSPNFPFAGWLTDSHIILSKAEIITRLPTRSTCDTLVVRYMEAVEGIHGFFYIPAFEKELDSFWNESTEPGYAWLAQLFVVLALGYEATPQDEQSLLIKSYHNRPRQVLLETAASCLQRTTIMFRADITLIRVLCLLVVAKLTGSYMCSIIDSCGPLTDMAIRACVELGVQKPGGECHLTRQIQTRLWISAVYLKVQQAANSGTPLLLRSSDFDTSILGNLDNNNLSNAAIGSSFGGYNEMTCQMVIARSLPIAISVVSAANSPGKNTAIGGLENQENEIIELLAHVQSLSDEPTASDRFGWRKLQKPMLKIWLRRILLIIHQMNNSPIQGCPRVQDSRQKYLGCALGILVCQRQLLEVRACPMARILTMLFKQDFFIAAVGACTTLKQGERWKMHARRDYDDWELGRLGISTRETIQDALFWCKELWARDVYQSTCNFWAHLILERLTDGL